jgi:hypothetical protein
LKKSVGHRRRLLLLPSVDEPAMSRDVADCALGTMFNAAQYASMASSFFPSRSFTTPRTCSRGMRRTDRAHRRALSQMLESARAVRQPECHQSGAKLRLG